MKYCLSLLLCFVFLLPLCRPVFANDGWDRNSTLSKLTIVGAVVLVFHFVKKSEKTPPTRGVSSAVRDDDARFVAKGDEIQRPTKPLRVVVNPGGAATLTEAIQRIRQRVREIAKDQQFVAKGYGLQFREETTTRQTFWFPTDARTNEALVNRPTISEICVWVEALENDPTQIAIYCASGRRHRSSLTLSDSPWVLKEDYGEMTLFSQNQWFRDRLEKEPLL